MEKTKCAVIGCGTIGRGEHIPAYAKNPKVELKYLCDILIERAEEQAEKYGIPNAVKDYHEILADPEVEAISVCVPNYLHAPITIHCLNAGKNVLCEKPIALTYEQAVQMKEAADRNGKILNIGVVNRFNTSVNMVRDLIQAGELGELYHVYCSFKSFRSIPGLGGAFTTKALSGGGVLIDWGVHFLDLALYCLGSAKPTAVSAEAYSMLGKDMKEYAYTDMWAGPPNYDGVYDVEEYVTGLIRTEGPSIGFSGAWAQNINESAMYIEFLGSKAGIKLKYGQDFTMYSSKNGILYETKPTYKSVKMFEAEINSFGASAVSGKKTQGNIDNVIVVQKILDSIYQSAEMKKEIVL